jgi:hypothetical protein
VATRIDLCDINRALAVASTFAEQRSVSRMQIRVPSLRTMRLYKVDFCELLHGSLAPDVVRIEEMPSGKHDGESTDVMS